MRLACFFLVVTFSVLSIGCGGGGSSAPPSEEKKKEMEADMQAEMQEMMKSVPQEPGKGK